MRTVLALWCLACLSSIALPAPAQIAADSLSGAIPAIDGQTILRLRSIDELAAAALQHSPLLQIQDLRIENVGEKMRILRRRWSDFIFLDGAYQYGNGAFFDNVQTSVEDRSQVLVRENSFYRAGLSIRLPIGDFVSRKPRVQLLENELEEEKYQRLELERQLRQAVIQQYQDLKLQLRLMAVKTEELEFHQANNRLAEQYFREGDLEMSELSRVVMERSRAEESLLRARQEAELAFLLLRELVGVEITY